MQKGVKSRIASIQNIQKITGAMQMVAAARLRKAEDRITALRPYAEAIRRMTREAAIAAGSVPQMKILTPHSENYGVGLLFVTADRGLAGGFNSQIVRAGLVLSEQEKATRQLHPKYYAVGRRGASSLKFRDHILQAEYTGFTDQPSYRDARYIAADLVAAYVDKKVDRVDIIYNKYISPLTQEVTVETLLPIQNASIFSEHDDVSEDQVEDKGPHALVEYEPEAQEILERLIPIYVEISIYRALLESAASEHGARMTAMRSASDNAGELIKTLTLQMNRERQAAITQEIMEVVAGAESLV